MSLCAASASIPAATWVMMVTLCPMVMSSSTSSMTCSNGTRKRRRWFSGVAAAYAMTVVRPTYAVQGPHRGKLGDQDHIGAGCHRRLALPEEGDEAGVLSQFEQRGGLSGNVAIPNLERSDGCSPRGPRETKGGLEAV